MTQVSKRQKEIAKILDKTKKYDFAEAIRLFQEEIPKVKFNESVEASIMLGIDSKKSDQVVRGACPLPHGTGKTIRIAVFAQGAQAEAAKAAGADIVGYQDLAESIKAGDMNFDLLIATPDAMPLIGKLGQILGPKGLMPNPKIGTVTADVGKAVSQAKAGQVSFRSEKAGIVHALIGKLDFTANQLQENLQTVLATLKRLRPQTSKGVYFKKLVLATTMGPGIEVNLGGLHF